MADELSPYLLQHAHNPVLWLPWGDEAFDRARRENKPLFLSIGYAACHWCHVMAHESFENVETAEFLNAHFIPVKVDREERPDVDEVYMTAVQMLTGSGGWPLSVFLTPGREPLFGGTYFPPDDRPGMPSFRNVLREVARAWESRPAEVAASARSITEVLRHTLHGAPPAGAETDASATQLARKAMARLQNAFDSEWGGFGGAPKFPPCGSLLLLLRSGLCFGNKEARRMVELTLDKMASGGLHDPVGGGFHRYAVDRAWNVPHFEKMLYDNALLGRVYIEAFQATGRQRYKEIALDTLDFVSRDMTDASGAFHASLDADSEGGEGRFYLWTRDEMKQILGDERSARAWECFGITPEPNFEGSNILRASEAHSPWLLGVRADLLAARQRRPRPPKDDKIVTAWNGLMISCFAHAHQATGREADRKAACAAAEFFRDRFLREGRLMHIYRNGTGKVDGFLDDYACLAAAALDVYESSFETRWLEFASGLLDQMLIRFSATAGGKLQFASSQHNELPAAARSFTDSATPSPFAAATAALLRASILLDRPAYAAAAAALLREALPLMAEHTAAYAHMLCAALMPELRMEAVLVGPAGSSQTQALLQALRSKYMPNKVTAYLDPSASNAEALQSLIPLLRGKTAASGRSTLYLCRNGVCKKPMTDAGELATLLGSAGPTKMEA
jgi:uncharacterized protein YyaL (SSP411 family)